MTGLNWRTCAIVGLALGLSASSSPAKDKQASKLPAPPAAAIVNGEPVYVGEVDAGLAELTKLRAVDADGIELARAGMLRELVNRRLIEQSLEKQGTSLDRAAAETEMQKLVARLKDKHQTLEEYATTRAMSAKAVRREQLWPLVWNQYLERHLAEELPGYFQEHRRELDGTELRVGHILLRAEAKESLSQLAERAEKIRSAILAKTITFEQASEKYSAGPSRRQGGDLGSIPRYGVMSEEFSKAAFALKPGEISKPVISSFGTHLIRVTEVKPGTQEWSDVAAQIRPLAAKQLFEKLAREQRETAKIEFTGKSAYFKPGTDELVQPDAVAEK